MTYAHDLRDEDRPNTRDTGGYRQICVSTVSTNMVANKSTTKAAQKWTIKIATA